MPNGMNWPNSPRKCRVLPSLLVCCSTEQVLIRVDFVLLQEGNANLGIAVVTAMCVPTHRIVSSSVSLFTAFLFAGFCSPWIEQGKCKFRQGTWLIVSTDKLLTVLYSEYACSPCKFEWLKPLNHYTYFSSLKWPPCHLYTSASCDFALNSSERWGANIWKSKSFRTCSNLHQFQYSCCADTRATSK